MTLSGLELSALISAGIIMSNADGKRTDDEDYILIKELTSFNVSHDDAKLYLNVAVDMSSEYTVEVLKAMSDDKKKYACGYLAAVMAADEDIAEKELEAWVAFSTLCNFPTMTLGDAYEFWRNN